MQEDVARALVLVDVAHRVEVAGRERIGAFMTGNIDGFASLDEAADAIAAYNPHRPRPDRPVRAGQEPAAATTTAVGCGTGILASCMGKFGSADETRASVVDPHRLEKAVDALRLPALLVRGRASDLLSEEGAQDFLDRVPHAEFADVAGAGHMVAGDRNEIFNHAILDFLERHRT